MIWQRSPKRNSLSLSSASRYSLPKTASLGSLHSRWIHLRRWCADFASSKHSRNAPASAANLFCSGHKKHRPTVHTTTTVLGRPDFLPRSRRTVPGRDRSS